MTDICPDCGTPLEYVGRQSDDVAEMKCPKCQKVILVQADEIPPPVDSGHVPVGLSFLEEMVNEFAKRENITPAKKQELLGEFRRLIKEGRTNLRELKKVARPVWQYLRDIKSRSCDEKVPEYATCPGCGERLIDQFGFVDDDRVKCYTCGVIQDLS